MGCDCEGQGALLDIMGKVHVSIGESNARLGRVAHSLSKPLPQPVIGRTLASGTPRATGSVVLRFDQPGPDQGHFWQVRSICVGGLTTTTTAAGRADIFVSASDLTGFTLAQIGIADWRDQLTTLPAFTTFYSRGALTLRQNEKLFVAISSGTVGQLYVAAATYEDNQEGPRDEAWAI